MTDEATNNGDPIRELIEMLQVGTTTGAFDHTPDEFGLYVMENAAAILAVLTPLSDEITVDANTANSHCFYDRIVSREEGCIAFASQPWSSRIAAALAAISPGYTAPDGWQMVPIEATEAMIDAAWNADNLRVGWDKMLDAAPHPRAAVGEHRREWWTLQWIAAPRPPVHMHPMRGSQDFDTAEAALAFWRGKPADSTYVGLTRHVQTSTLQSPPAEAEGRA